MNISVSPTKLVPETHVDLHLSVESVVEEEVVGHAYPMRFHGVPLSVVVITNVTCIERQRQRDEWV